MWSKSTWHVWKEIHNYFAKNDCTCRGIVVMLETAFYKNNIFAVIQCLFAKNTNKIKAKQTQQKIQDVRARNFNNSDVDKVLQESEEMFLFRYWEILHVTMFIFKYLAYNADLVEWSLLVCWQSAMVCRKPLIPAYWWTRNGKELGLLSENK